jgi:hypothetical protein
LCLNIFRVYFLGILVPITAYMFIKKYAHDEANYYNAYFIENPKSPDYKRESNPHYQQDKIKEMLRKYRDNEVLGRSILI